MKGVSGGASALAGNDALRFTVIPERFRKSTGSTSAAPMVGRCICGDGARRECPDGTFWVMGSRSTT